jgi:hypothetical protein
LLATWIALSHASPDVRKSGLGAVPIELIDQSTEPSAAKG